MVPAYPKKHSRILKNGIYWLWSDFGDFQPLQKSIFAPSTLLKSPYLLKKNKRKIEKGFVDFLELLLSYPGVFLGMLGPYSCSEIVILEKKVEKSRKYK